MHSAIQVMLRISCEGETLSVDDGSWMEELVGWPYLLPESHPGVYDGVGELPGERGL